MSKNIFRVRTEIESFRDGRARLYVAFTDIKGSSRSDLEWTPRWEDVCDLMVQAVEVERRNKPGSTYLEQFAKVCSDIVVRYAPADHVQILAGYCVEYESNAVRVIYRELTDRPGWVAGEAWWTLGIPLAADKLRDLINKDVTWVVWDGKVIQIRE